MKRGIPQGSNVGPLLVLICIGIFIRNGKIVWKHGPYCWYFCLNLKYLGLPYRELIKTAKNGGFCEEWLIENDFGDVLATFCCCDYCANAYEAVHKIATDQKDYHKCSLHGKSERSLRKPKKVLLYYPQKHHWKVLIP